MSLSRRDFLKLAGLLPAAALPAFLAAPRRAADPAAPNILLLVFDTLSAPHMSLYGYPRQTTPNFARFAEQCYVYRNHHAGANFTSPGTASLLTGTLPWTHRAVHLHSTVEPAFADRNLFALAAAQGYYQTAYTHNLLVMSLLHQFRSHLDAFVPTRDLCLADDEYADRLFPNDYTNAFLSEWQYLRGGQDSPGSFFLGWLHRLLRYAHKTQLTRDLGAEFPRGIPSLHNLFFILEDALDWVRAQAAALPRPWLNYTHLLPPHEPYTTRRDFINIFNDGWKPDTLPPGRFNQYVTPQQLLLNRRLYDEYLAYADAEFGRLVDNLQADGVLDETWLIFTSDHGESFERGIRGHVTPALYQPLLRVPLLIRPPGGAPARLDIHTPTSNVDLLPTLMTIMGAPVPPWAEGRPLPPFAAPLPERAIFAVEAKSNPKHTPLTQSTVALVQGDHKIIRYSGYGEAAPAIEMFDLRNDPQELNDLSAANPPLAADLRAALEAALQRADEPYAR
jgi:arylsulfatase A-like enzyme